MRAIKGIVGGVVFSSLLLIFCSVYMQTEDQQEPTLEEIAELDEEQAQEANDISVKKEDEDGFQIESADESPAEKIEKVTGEESKEKVTEAVEPEDEEGPKEMTDKEPKAEDEEGAQQAEGDTKAPEDDDAKVVKESDETEAEEADEKAEEADEKAEEPEKEAEKEELEKPSEEEKDEKSVEEEKPKTLEEAVPPTPEPVTSEDFDTIKLKEYGGNWFEKRKHWQRSEEEYEKVRQALDQVFDARVYFIQRRNDLDRNTFDPFYEDMGVVRGSLDELLDDLIDRVEGERPLSLKEREFYDLLQGEKKSIEQIRMDVACIIKHEDALDNAIGMVTKQINAARQYEQYAWQEFKAIADDLNDIKARERYFTIKTMYKNIKNVNEYLRGSLKQYFDEIEQMANQEIERAKEMQATLKSKGIDLRKEAKKLFGEEDEEEVVEEEKPVATEPVEEEEPAPEELGFFGGLWVTITGGIKAVWNFLFGWLYRF